MIEYFRERALIAALVLFAAFVLLPWEKITWNSAPSANPYAETSGESGSGPAKFPRVEAVRNARHKEAPGALAKLDDILAKPQSPAEEKAARELLPELLELSYFQHVRDKQPDLARKLHQRLAAVAPTENRTLGVQYSWGRELAAMHHQAVAARDDTRVREAFEEYRAGGYFLPPAEAPAGGAGAVQGSPGAGRKRLRYSLAGEAYVLEEHARYQMARWQEVPAASRMQGEGFLLAADAFGVLHDHNACFQFAELVLADTNFYGAQLLPLVAEFEKKGLAAAAFNAAIAAHHAAGRQDRWDEAGRKRERDYLETRRLIADLESLVGRLALTVSSVLETNHAGVASAMAAEQFLDVATGLVHSPDARAGLYARRRELLEARYLDLSEPLLKYDFAAIAGRKLPYEELTKFSELLHQVRVLGGDVESAGKAIVQNARHTTNAVVPYPWARVQPRVLAAIEQRVPPNTEPDRLEDLRRGFLEEMISEGRVEAPVAQSSEYVQRRLHIRALDAVYNFEGSREEAFRNLRVVLNEGGDAALAAASRRALQEAFRRSFKEGKFESLIEVAGFYAGEFGESLRADPFRTELRDALTTSADKFKSGDKMKYVFVEALLATVFAGEPVGRQAQVETIARAFDLVARTAINTNRSSFRMPSGLQGFSTVAVDNSTDHHILVVYDGPEKFSVLCNPLRKGSFTVLNGTYRIAVLTPLGSIVPYRAERRLMGEHAPDDYYIRRSNEPTDQRHSSAAYGNYALLRTAVGTENATVDPQTGRFGSGMR